MKKKNTGLIVCIVILILIVLGLVGFIVYDKVINNKPNDNIESKELYSIKKLGDKVLYTGKSDLEIISSEIIFAYPVININSKEIRKVNSEILKVYQDVYSFIDSNYTKEVSETPMCQITINKNGKLYGGENTVSPLRYIISENDKYLSVVIEETHITMCGGGSTSYLGYTINKETKKVMSNSEILELFNASNLENVFVDAYNENAQSIGLGNAKSIDDLRLYVYDGELVLCLTTNGDYLLKYSNGKLGAV
ncbi:MAG: hypothetical protein MRZ35_00040 [Firmicutes bacterium]|nr:hypothetical protein [Bacillota bacterium]